MNVLHTIRSVLSTTQNVVSLLPKKDDTFFGKSLKTIAIIDTLSVALNLLKNQSEREDVLDGLNSKYNLEWFGCGELVRIFQILSEDNFFSKRLKSTIHEIRTAQCNIKLFEFENYRIALYVDKSGNILAPAKCTSIGYSKGFEFKILFDEFWRLYSGRIHYFIDTENKSISFSGLEKITNPMYGSISKDMTKLLELHRGYLARGISRAYMFYGKPGTGKTSSAIEIAQKIGGKLLKIDSETFCNITAGQLSFLLNNFEPDFVIVDDIDKVQNNKPLLDIMSKFKYLYPKTSVILTANSLNTLDQGLLRPGRIDTFIEFNPPDDNERRAIFNGYVNELGISLNQDQITELVEKTNALTQDYIREIAISLAIDNDFDNTIKKIFIMKRVLS